MDKLEKLKEWIEKKNSFVKTEEFDIDIGIIFTKFLLQEIDRLQSEEEVCNVKFQPLSDDQFYKTDCGNILDYIQNYCSNCGKKIKEV